MFSLPSWISPLPNLFAFEKVVTEGSWRQAPPPEEERTEAQRIPRRRLGSGRRSRPRPLSDYGQLVARSLSIPEDSIAVDPQKEDAADSDHQPSVAPTDPADQTPAGGYPQGGPRRRPISVIGGVGFYGSSQTEEGEALLPQVRPPCCPQSLLASVLSLQTSQTFPFFSLPQGWCHLLTAFLPDSENMHELELTH